MKIPALDSVGVQGMSQLAEQNTGVKFAEVRAEVANQKELSKSFFGADTFGDLRKVEQAVLSGQKISPEQMLSLQIKMNDAHLRVELLSKAAESAVSTMKRLQNPQ